MYAGLLLFLFAYTLDNLVICRCIVAYSVHTHVYVHIHKFQIKNNAYIRRFEPHNNYGKIASMHRLNMFYLFHHSFWIETNKLFLLLA